MTTQSFDGPTGPSGPQRYADDARRYRLDSRIATGGMGEVWRGTDTVLGREVAIKVLKTEYADDPTFRTRFQTEAQHAASLHHPGVAAVYDFGEAAPTDGSGLPSPYLVMELVNGQPLSALLRGGRSLDPDVARDLLAQAADAIGAAHAAGIVHRDVKPANLLVTPERVVKITDFGIARAAEGLALTQTGQVMGTPQYLSPEQARGNPATPSSDLYSLGVVAYECLAGRRPFDAGSPVATALAHLNDDVPDLPDDVPADLAAVVRRAMAKDPADRYADAGSFAAALRDPGSQDATQLVASPAVPEPVAQRTQVMGAVPPPLAPTPIDPTPTPPPVPPAEPRGPQRRSAAATWGLVLLFAILAAVVVVVALQLSGGDDDPSDEASPSAAATNEPSDPSTGATDPTTEPTEAETFDLDEDDYLDRNVDEVGAELRAKGLRPEPERVDNPDGETPGTVAGVRPTTNLQAGDSVTVTYWDEEPEPTEEPSESGTPSPSPSPSASSSPSASPSPSASGSPLASDSPGNSGNGNGNSGNDNGNGNNRAVPLGREWSR